MIQPGDISAICLNLELSASKITAEGLDPNFDRQTRLDCRVVSFPVQQCLAETGNGVILLVMTQDSTHSLILGISLENEFLLEVLGPHYRSCCLNALSHSGPHNHNFIGLVF